MKHRNPIAVILLSLITFGIYGLYWEVKTKGEMNARGAAIPTAWLIIIPFVNIWWLWKYSEGVEKVTNGKMSTVIAFVLLFVLGYIGAGVIQDSFNKVSGGEVATSAAPVAPVAPVSPEATSTVAPTEANQPPANPVS